MYLASSPALALVGTDHADRFPLPLARIVTRTFDGVRPYDANMLGFFHDLAELYGLRYDRAEFARLRRATFTDMVGGLLDELDGGGEPVGLVVLAHSAPDGEPNWPACFLTGVLPGEPLGFAVADQGAVAPFTALRIAATYLRANGARRAIAIVLDQSTVLCDPALAGQAPVPTQNRAVALIFDERGGLGELSVRTSAGIGPGDVGSALRGWVPATGGHRPAVVFGPGLAAEIEPSTVDGRGSTVDRGWSTVDAVAVPPGLPCTGIWAVLAGELDRWRSAGRQHVLLADYDPESHCLGQCVVSLPGPGRQR